MMAEHWEPLTNTMQTAFYAGTVFRFPAQYPYEAIVDFMLVGDNSASDPELRVVPTTGRKSGFVNLVSMFPKAAYLSGSLAICPLWLSVNWKEYVYEDCEANEVYVTQGYLTAPRLPTG